MGNQLFSEWWNCDHDPDYEYNRCGTSQLLWSEFPSRTVWYAASDAQVREMRGILAQLNFSVPPKPERKSEPMPDKPDASLILLDMGVIVEHTSQNLLTGSAPEPTNPCAALRAYTCSKLGNEDVNGRHTQKWEMKDTQNGNVMTVWIDPSLPWAVKTPSATFTSELRNLKEEPQPESLFQVPSDYRKSVAKD